MIYGQQKTKEMAPKIALALGTYKMSDSEIYERLYKLAGKRNSPAPSLSELRKTLDKELGDHSLTAELRSLRDEE